MYVWWQHCTGKTQLYVRYHHGSPSPTYNTVPNNNTTQSTSSNSSSRSACANGVPPRPYTTGSKVVEIPYDKAAESQDRDHKHQQSPGRPRRLECCSCLFHTKAPPNRMTWPPRRIRWHSPRRCAATPAPTQPPADHKHKCSKVTRSKNRISNSQDRWRCRPGRMLGRRWPRPAAVHLCM